MSDDFLDFDSFREEWENQGDMPQSSSTDSTRSEWESSSIGLQPALSAPRFAMSVSNGEPTVLDPQPLGLHATPYHGYLSGDPHLGGQAGWMALQNENSPLPYSSGSYNSPPSYISNDASPYPPFLVRNHTRPPSASLQLGCPIFEADTIMGRNHVCTGKHQPNMAGVRTHIGRSHREIFLERCPTCEQDIVDQQDWTTSHGERCHNPQKQPRGDEAVKRQWDTLYQKLNPPGTPLPGHRDIFPRSPSIQTAVVSVEHATDFVPTPTIHAHVTAYNRTQSYSADSDVKQDSMVCSLCDKEFSGQYCKGNLARHRRQKHGEEEQIYQCEEDVCPRLFKRQDARLKHYRRHHPWLAPNPQLSRRF